jgi:hypothetical protein
MEAIVPPLFAIDREGWVRSFDSLEDLEAGLEINDVDADEYRALAANGRWIRLRLNDEDESGARWYLRHGPRVQGTPDTGELHCELLRELLLEATGAESDDLAVLLERAAAMEDLRAPRTIDVIRAALR